MAFEQVYRWASALAVVMLACVFQQVRAADCNGDGQEDDLVGNDCNHNFILDDCDVASGLVTFLQDQIITVGDQPGGVAVGDFDNDGDQDVAVANRVSSTISILKNTAGSLAVTSTLTAGGFPVGIVTGKFNNDAHIDVAVANFTPDTLSLFINNGDATFQAPVTVALTAASNPWGLATADLDGDNDLDFAVASQGLDKVFIVKNNNGTFTQTATLTVGDSPRNITTGDIDGDGDMDLACANGGADTVSVLRNNGNATFQAATTIPAGDEPWGIGSADFNGDGFADFAVSHDESDNVKILISNGLGGFTLSQTLTVDVAPQGLLAADVTGEGAPDVVTANLTGGNISALLNIGNGTLSPAVSFCTGAGANAIAAGDLDGDGIADAISTSSTQDSISVLSNSSSCVDCNVNGKIDACEKDPFFIGFETVEGFRAGDVQSQVGWFRKRIDEDGSDPFPRACPDLTIPGLDDVACGQALVAAGSPIGTGLALKLKPDPGLADSEAWAAWSPNMLEPELEIDIWEWDTHLTNMDGPDYNVWIQGACDEAPAVVRLKYEYDGDVRYWDWNSEVYVNTEFEWTPGQTFNTRVTINLSIGLITLEFNDQLYAFTFPQLDSGSQEIIFENDNYMSAGEDAAWFDNIMVTTIPDCNGNGIDDAVDVANGEPDENGDGIPDVCQEDCNGDGELDPNDCNENFILDECDIMPYGASSDCNDNGVPDECETVGGGDCNFNGIPDVCETDTDNDGTIDDCDNCPTDPTETEPGVCGCGVPEDDPDGDGVASCVDNCDTTSNPDQTDTDGDGIGDACEDTGCPGDANGDNIVDPLDSGYALSRFGCAVGTGNPDCDAADQNGDNIVDPLDVGYILSRFGVCP